MSTFKKLLPMILIILFEFLVGILLLVDGEKFTRIIFIIFGIFLLVYGIITLIRSLMAGRNGGSIPMMSLIVSIILLGIGAFFAAASDSIVSVVSVITLIYGIILIIDGVIKIVDYSMNRKDGVSTAFMLFSAVISLALGIVIAINPFGAAQVLWVVLGISVIVSAVIDVISLIFFAKAMKNNKGITVEVSAKDLD